MKDATSFTISHMSDFLYVRVRKFVLRLGTGLEISRRLDFAHMMGFLGCSKAHSNRLDQPYTPTHFVSRFLHVAFCKRRKNVF